MLVVHEKIRNYSKFRTTNYFIKKLWHEKGHKSVDSKSTSGSYTSRNIIILPSNQRGHLLPPAGMSAVAFLASPRSALLGKV
ncbi:hypothetical protein TNCV_593421 [Trichonephila clavipes]|nr:hypothetical protein TNCV_593421 [Trichonephila clavipes]